MIRVLLHVKDYLSAEAVWAAVKAQPGLEAVALTDTEDHLLRELEQARPRAVLLMPEATERGNCRLELIGRIRSATPAASIILLCQAHDPETVVTAFRSGVRGIFSLHDSPFDDLGKCIEHVQSGQVWASWQDLEWLVQSLNEHGGQTGADRLVDARGHQILSRREQEVVSLLLRGLPNREIAQALKLSEHTIKNYLFRIYDKLGISSRTELLVYVMSMARANVSRDPSRE